MTENMLYSIIIPSYNRAEEIDELLSSIENLDEPSPEFECVIVDDGSEDNTKEIVEEHQEDSEYSIRFIQQPNQGPGAARNNGMKQAKGDFFIFLDSDTLVDSHWLNAIDTVVQNGVQAFGGPDGASEDFTPLQKAINYSMTSFLTTGGIRGKKKSIGKYYPRSFNMGLSRDVYEEVGGFQEQQYGEDIDFSRRIYNTGAKVEFVEDAVVYHKRRSSLFSFITQVFKMGRARSVLIQQDKGLLELVYLLPAISVLIFAIIVVLALIGSEIALALLLFGVMGLIIVTAHSLTKTKSIKSAVYMPVIILAQVFGYGIGLIYGFMSSIIDLDRK